MQKFLYQIYKFCLTDICLKILLLTKINYFLKTLWAHPIGRHTLLVSFSFFLLFFSILFCGWYLLYYRFILILNQFF